MSCWLQAVSGAPCSCSEQLVDRHGVESAPIRGLLIDYLEERRHRLDYSTLDNLARNLTRNFWSDLERHHPGIASLDLPPEVVTAWKERLRTRVQRRRRLDGTAEETVVERADRALLMMAVRAFYLDIARWAVEELARWGGGRKASSCRPFDSGLHTPPYPGWNSSRDHTFCKWCARIRDPFSGLRPSCIRIFGTARDISRKLGMRKSSPGAGSPGSSR